MSIAPFPYRLYLVISEGSCAGRDLLQVAEQAIRGGVDIVQLREKGIDTDSFLQKAIRLKRVTDHYHIPLIINDNLEVAQTIDAFGIHVGNHDLPPGRIRKEWPLCRCLGYSVEYPEQLGNGEIALSDYLGISPVFCTETKKDTVTEWGLAGIAHIRSQTLKPLVAIGNMNRDNAAAALHAGADCIAVVSAICGATDPQAAARNLKQTLLRSV